MAILHGRKEAIAPLMANAPARAAKEAMIPPGAEAVFTAIRQRDAAACKKLLQAGAAAECYDQDGLSPMYIAAASGQINITELLLQHGATINGAVFVGKNPITAAIVYNQLDMLQWLQQHGGNLDMAKITHSGAFYYGSIGVAVKYRALDCLEYLLQQRAVNEQDSERLIQNPVLAALEVGWYEGLEILLEHGANFTTKAGQDLALAAAKLDDPRFCQRLAQAGCDFTATDSHGDNMLHHAARMMHEDTLRYLLPQAVEKINACNVNQETPLGLLVQSHIAAYDAHSPMPMPSVQQQRFDNCYHELTRHGARLSAEEKEKLSARLPQLGDAAFSMAGAPRIVHAKPNFYVP